MSEQVNINLPYLFVHILVYNKHLLFIMHGMNIKVSYKKLKDGRLTGLVTSCVGTAF